jgi:lipopolysaccharide export system ATP-binding protein
VSAPRLRALADRTGPADVSSLLALRALMPRADSEGVVERASWLTGLHEEYARWYASEGPGGMENFPPAETLRYLDEHVVRHLADEDVVSPVAGGGDGAAPWAAVRLSEWARAEVETGRRELLEHLDGRIRIILEHADGGAGVAPPPSQPGDHVAPPFADAGQAPPRRRPPAPVAGGATLRAAGLVKTYRKRRVVNDVDIHVSQGEIVGLLGPNGAGKTTSFYMMVGLIKPDRGTVHLAEKDLTKVPMFKRARAGIGYLAQEPSIFRRLTVEENVLAILQTMPLPKAEQHRRLEELLDELSIKHLRKTYAYALSGGERRRLEITRALVGGPKFMLLDEPFAGVDPIAVHDIQQIVSGLRQRGIGVLISDHNVEQTLDIVDRAYIMYDGRVRVSGTVSELVWNDEVAEIYLGPTLTARMRERYSNPDQEDAV